MLYRSLTVLMRAIPEPISRRAAGAIAYLVSYIAHRRFAVVRTNLAHVVDISGDELDRLVRRSFASYGRYWASAASLSGSTKLKASKFAIDRDGPFDAMLSGGAAILALPHLLNLQIMNSIMLFSPPRLLVRIENSLSTLGNLFMEKASRIS